MFIEGMGEEGLLELSGDEFDSDPEETTAPSFGPDPLDKAMAGVQRRRSPKLT